MFITQKVIKIDKDQMTENQAYKRCQPKYN